MKTLSLAVIALAVVGASAGAQEVYVKEMPDSLVRRAKIEEAIAAETAHKRLPKGHIEHVVLHTENGRLVYLYNVRTEGKSGLDEVRVSAVTGKVIGIHHEAESGGEMKKPE